MICHIMEHGNTSVYQWKTGKIPTVTFKMYIVIAVIYFDKTSSHLAKVRFTHG